MKRIFVVWNEILQKLRAACVSSDFIAIGEQDIAFHRSIVRRAKQRDVEAIWMTLIARVRVSFLADAAQAVLRTDRSLPRARAHRFRLSDW